MKYFVFALLLMAALSSCETSRYAYTSNAHNVPILAEKGDSKIAGAYSNNLWIHDVSEGDRSEYDRTISHGGDAQAAVAVTNHIALQGSFSFRREKQSYQNSYNSPFDSSRINYTRNLAEVGIGYYTPLDKRKQVLLQVYAGAGFGKTSIADRGSDFNGFSYSRFYDMNLKKYFIEPTVTFRASEIFAATLGTKFTLLKFGDIRSNYSRDEKQTLDLDSLDRYAIGCFEPIFIGSFGFNKLPGFRIEFQTGLSIIPDNGFIAYRPFNFSIGLAVDVRKLARGPVKK